MAAIERGEGAGDAVVEGWLTRALAAPRGPQWVCDNCHNIHREWVPVCENCHSFDTLSWRTPPAPDMVAPTGVEMLPLIVAPHRLDEAAEDVADLAPARKAAPTTRKHPSPMPRSCPPTRARPKPEHAKNRAFRSRYPVL